MALLKVIRRPKTIDEGGKCLRLFIENFPEITYNRVR